MYSIFFVIHMMKEITQAYSGSSLKKVYYSNQQMLNLVLPFETPVKLN